MGPTFRALTPSRRAVREPRNLLDGRRDSLAAAVPERDSLAGFGCGFLVLALVRGESGRVLRLPVERQVSDRGGEERVGDGVCVYELARRCADGAGGRRKFCA